MLKNKKKIEILKGGPISGIVLSILALIIMLFVIGKGIDKCIINEDITFIVIAAACFLSSMAGGSISAKGKIENAIICGGSLVLIKAVLSAFSDKTILISKENLIISLMFLLGSVIGGALTLKKGKGKSKKKKYR